MHTIDTPATEPYSNNHVHEATEKVVTVKSVEHVTHNVLCIKTTRPFDYSFIPGQATEVALNKEGWQAEKRPFTFTSLPEDDYLEFTIKVYPADKGVTNELLHLKEKDELLLHEVFGTIAYKGEGVFIAGGAGVTPFIAIFKQLQATGKIGSNKLICANKTKDDIIRKDYFTKLLGHNFINITSAEKDNHYEHGHISEDFLLKHISNFNQKFYICGPEPMMEAVEKQLLHLKVGPQQMVKEQF
jgi:ferredoxin-NADP reductase